MRNRSLFGLTFGVALSLSIYSLLVKSSETRDKSFQDAEVHCLTDLNAKVNAFYNRLVHENPGPNRFDLVGKVSRPCNLTIFATGDDEKRACPFTEDDCHVISIGSRGQWAFERDVVTKTRCRVSTFDCTGDFQVPDNLRERVTSYKICLARATKLPFLMDWVTMMAHAGVTKSPSYVKMDIEGHEWDVLQDMIQVGVFLPDQIAFELHWKTWKARSWESRGQLVGGPTWMGREKTAAEIALFMHMLYCLGKFRLASRNDNPFCSYCTELLLVRYA